MTTKEAYETSNISLEVIYHRHEKYSPEMVSPLLDVRVKKTKARITSKTIKRSRQEINQSRH